MKLQFSLLNEVALLHNRFQKVFNINDQCEYILFRLSKGNIEQQFSSINHGILIKIIIKKVKDQAFIDLLYKYLRIGYEKTPNNIIPLKIGVIQGEILSLLLSNIYMHTFDEWLLDFKNRFDKSTKQKVNPLYYPEYAKHGKAKDKTIGSVIEKNAEWKKMYYFRYADDFIIGVDSNKKDCIDIKNSLKFFLKATLELTLNLSKTKITHAKTDSVKFLGYTIHKTKLKKRAIKFL